MNSQDFPSTVSIAIPAYKAEKELQEFLPKLLDYVPNNQVTVLLDGIYDNAEGVCRELGVEVLVHEQNQGKGAALTSLFSHLQDHSEWIITMDADGQHLPEELQNFTDAIQSVSKPDSILIGSRPRNRSTMPLLRRFSNGTTSAFLSLVSGRKILDSQCGFRAYRSSVVSEIECISTRFEMESEILLRAAAKGYTFQNIPVSTHYNGETSHISHVKDTLRWIRTVLKTMIAVRRSSTGEKLS